MEINKRGMVFTLVAIALVSLFSISYSVYSFVNDRSSIDSRVESMNRYIFSMQEDFSRKLYISSFRIIFVYEKRIAEGGRYINDVDSTFEEAFFYGTINGTVDSSEQTLFDGVLFDDVVNSLNSDASKLNLQVNFTNPHVSISQKDPWNVFVNLTGDLTISDLGGLASWNKTTSIVAYIPIGYFEDPLYIINTNGLVPRKFNRTVYLFDSTSVLNLTNHLEGKYYVASGLAPSFLNRLEGNLTASPNGVESLVYLPDLASQGISLLDKSIVDYIYFSSDNPSKNKISGMPSWVQIDSAHQGFYNVSSRII